MTPHPGTPALRPGVLLVLLLPGMSVGALPAQGPAGADRATVSAAAAVAPVPLPGQGGPPSPSARVVAFETTQGTAMNVDVSPDGKILVFDLLGDLYTVPITGGMATRLTSGPAFDTEPVFSPDGGRIAFVSDRSGSENLWLVDADGRHPRAFTAEATVAVTRPEWVTGGEFMLVARKADGYWLYRADGNGTPLQSRLPPGVRLGGGDVGWSRDGRFLYHTARWRSAQRLDVARGTSEIRRIDVARGGSESLSQGGPDPFRLTVSPDGRWVVFGSQLKNTTGLRLLNVLTREVRWLVYPLPDRDNSMLRDGTSPALPRFTFLPDGTTIVLATGGTLQRLDVRTGALRPIRFRATVEQELRPRVPPGRTLERERRPIRGIRDGQRDRTGTRTVFTALGRVWVREGGRPARPLVEQPAAMPLVRQREPALSPDGHTVAYVTWHDVHGGQLWRVPMTGGVPRQLTRLPGVYRHPVWSPDGSQLAVVREEEVPDRRRAAQIAADVYVLPATGGRPRRVAAGDADDIPAFSADGKAVLVVARPVPAGPVGRAPAARPRPVLLAVELGTGMVDTVVTLPEGAEQVAVSPDGKSVAYSKREHVYIAGIRSISGLPPGPATVTEGAGLWPATRVTPDGGADLRWEADSRTLTWVRDSALVRLTLAQMRGGGNSAPVPGATGSDKAGGSMVEVTPLALPMPRPDSVRSTAIEGATVITMRGGEVLRDAMILVTGSRIAAVGPRGSVPLPADAHRIDVAGRTIIPGLVDLYGEVPLARDLLEGTNIPLAADLAFGVTTVHAVPAGDSAGPEAALAAAGRYAELLDTGAMTGARLLAGGMVTSADATELTGPDAARVLVRRRQELGAAAIVQRGGLTRRQRRWLAAAAREAGLPLIGESGDLRLALTMAADGYDAVQGAIPNAQLYDDVRRFIAAAQTVYVPTLLSATGGRPDDEGRVGTAEEYFLEMTDLRADPKLRRFGLDTAGEVAWRLLEDYHFLAVGRQTARLAALGVPIAVGTAGKRPGLGVHWEMLALAMGGLSAHDALRAATATAAEALGLGHELGTIEVGKVADLVVLDADPLADLRNSRTTRYVMTHGALFDATTLAMLWPRVTPPVPLRDARYDPPLPTSQGVARAADRTAAPRP